MEPNRRKAYRLLLYTLTLEVRSLENLWSSGITRSIPFAGAEARRAVKRAGITANCLHNLALFSAVEFDGFREETFWGDLESLSRRFPEVNLGAYRRLFDCWLALAPEDGPGPELWHELWGRNADHD